MTPQTETATAADHELIGGWLPTGGEEGRAFTSRWCDQCTQEGPTYLCPILTDCYFHRPRAEWVVVVGLPGWQPRCTSFVPKFVAAPSLVEDR